MKLRDLLRNRTPDPSKTDGHYQDSLIQVTKSGTYFPSGFFLIFAAVYWLGGYPLLAVWVNLAAVLCSVIGLVLIKRFGMY